MVPKGTNSSYTSVYCIGLRPCLVQLSISSECLCVFSLQGAIRVVNYLFLLTSFSLPFNELSLVGLTLHLVD